MVSMSSSIHAQSFKHDYGRGLNDYSEVYQLPADGKELDRLGRLGYASVLGVSGLNVNVWQDEKHITLMEVMGRYPPPMSEVLSEPPPGEQPVACIDLGCGSGYWFVSKSHLHPSLVPSVDSHILGSWMSRRTSRIALVSQ